jgi:monoamine oxidase
MPKPARPNDFDVHQWTIKYAKLLGVELDPVTPPTGAFTFAGDHTSPSPGWMNGALQSGNRVAQEVAARRR